MSEAAPLAFEPSLLETSVSSDAPYVGQTVTYTIRIGHAPEISVKLPTKLDLSPFVLNGVRHTTEATTGEAARGKAAPGAPGRVAASGTVVERFEIDLGVYALEGGPIPPIAFEVETTEGPAELAVAGPKLTVQTTTAEEGAEPKALAPPVNVWVSDHTLLIAGAGFLGFLLLALVAWRLISRARARRRARPAPPEKLRPLDTRTLAALEALQAQGLVAAGKRRLYFFALSEIVRAYLGERFGFDAMESTSTELLVALRDRPTPGLESARFTAWCELGDLAKFSRYPPTDAECSDALTEAVEIVHKTTAAAEASTARPAAPTPAEKVA